QESAGPGGHHHRLAMEVLWLKGAVTDLDEIVTYLAELNPAAAAKTAAALQDAASLLGDHPRMGRKGRVSGTRELVVSRLPSSLLTGSGWIGSKSCG
ncbi:MAG: type II toxin-antitoxin system RelE/ParE family toxin, partial [Geminicoccaceae bacterium]